MVGFLLVVLTAALLTADAPAVAAVSSEQAVAFLNQQRATNGIPGDLVADSDLKLGCLQHNNYMDATDSFGHGEDQSSPYYTPEGGGEGPYGGAEVLAWGDGFTPQGENPWEWAPIHLYLLLDPEGTAAGYDAGHGYSCMRIRGQRTEDTNPPPQFFSYPGPGTQGIYPDEQAYEWPYTPQQLVGIPEGQVTGTNILLFSLGTRGLRAESFSLQGPGGNVPARMVDEGTENEVGSGGWFRGGGVLVPEQPLAQYTTYTVVVRWRNLAYEATPSEYTEESELPLVTTPFFTQEFNFTTGATSRQGRESQPLQEPVLRLVRAGKRGRYLRLRLTSDRSLRDHDARFVVYRHERGCGPRFATAASSCGWDQLGRPMVRTLRLRGTQFIEVREPERWQKATIKARTRGFRVGDLRYASAFVRYIVKR
jgi:hypothetical protein